MLYLESNGLIDIRCITTIGVSVKETKNPIGFFGTGLKYAIAIILRNGGKISIWRGFEEYKFGVKLVMIRGETQSIVTMNEVELGFTTHLGHHWVPWMAFRELYTNTLDEEGKIGTYKINPKPDTTLIIVDLHEIEKCFLHKSDYILESKPIHTELGIEFHRGITKNLYYRCIKVGETPFRPWYFTTNITDQVTLTEDRTIADQWGVDRLIAKTVIKATDKSFLKEFLTISNVYREHYIDINWYSEKVSEEFLDVTEEILNNPHLNINRSAVQLYRIKRPPPIIESIDLRDNEEWLLAEAINFCKALKYPVDTYRIVIVESLGEGVLGKAEDNQIFIARRSIQMGQLMLASTLIEEWVHLKHGFEDCTRELQNWLFEQLTILGDGYLRVSRKKGGSSENNERI